MNNFEKFLMTKPRNFITTGHLSKKYGIGIKTIQIYARTLNIQKDAAGIYVFDKEAVKRFNRLMKISGIIPVKKRKQIPSATEI